MEFCPVLVQINHNLLKKEYKSDYLLQVWNKEGRKVYQKPLQSKIHFFSSVFVSIDQIKIWGISNDYLIYKPQVGDEDFDCYHITNLRNENSTLLIKDCVNDPSCTKKFLKILILYFR